MKLTWNPQNDFRKPKGKQSDEVLPFISTFNPNNLSVSNSFNFSNLANLSVSKHQTYKQ